MMGDKAKAKILIYTKYFKINAWNKEPFMHSLKGGGSARGSIYVFIISKANGPIQSKMQSFSKGLYKLKFYYLAKKKKESQSTNWSYPYR